MGCAFEQLNLIAVTPSDDSPLTQLGALACPFAHDAQSINSHM